MKKLFASKLCLTKLSLSALSLASTSAFAHTGHLANDTVHSLLHVEHIIAIAAIGLIAYFVNVLSKK